MAHRDISLRCRIWSLSGHSGHRVSRTNQARFMSTRPRLGSSRKPANDPQRTAKARRLARPPITTLGRTGCLLSGFPLVPFSYSAGLLFRRHTPLPRIAAVMRHEREQRRIEFSWWRPSIWLP
jgi:hypothetical protein